MKNISLFLCIIAFLCSCNKGNKQHFSYKLIPVEMGDKWGYADHDGKLAINPQFKEAWLFAEGIAAVKTTDDKCGFINEDGKYLINPTYKSITNFSEGLAFATPENGFPTAINKDGKIKFELKNASFAGEFREGLALVIINKKYGFVDKAGKIAIPAQYDMASSFSNGRAAVWKDKKAGYIDATGKLIINYQFAGVQDFKGGYAAVRNNENKYGFIDKEGKYIINPQFDAVNDFSDGLVAVKQGNMWGYADASGKLIINPQFEQAGDFCNGLAPVKVGKSWGYINKEGKIIINPQFDAAGDFYDNVAAVVNGDKAGFIDHDGKYTANPQFDGVFGYMGGFKMFMADVYPFRNVTSDFFDVDAVVDRLITQISPNSINGLSANTSIGDIMQLPDIKDHPNNTFIYDHFIGSTITHTLTENVILDTIEYFSLSPTMHNNSKLSFVYYRLSLKKNAQGKETQLTNSLVNKLTKYYGGIADTASAYYKRYRDFDSTAMDIKSWEENGIKDRKIIYGSRISFIITQKINQLIVCVKLWRPDLDL